MTSPGERGILVDQNMRSISDKNIYAAGDCCTVHNWPTEETPNWFQARPKDSDLSKTLATATCLQKTW